MNVSLPILENSQEVQNIQIYSGDLNEDVKSFRTVKEAVEIHGGLSSPSKMPCYSYNIPASLCKTGSVLKNVKDSVCYGCYAADDWEWAKQGKHYTNYAWNNVKNALRRRYESLNNPLWVPAMIRSIVSTKKEYFRWHDSGDIQSVEHLENIAIIARHTPKIKYWLPTREYKFIEAWNAFFEKPKNLCIRVSGHMINQNAPKTFEQTSMVVDNNVLLVLPKNAKRCNAWKNDNKCGTCRHCWNNSVGTVLYRKH